MGVEAIYATVCLLLTQLHVAADSHVISAALASFKRMSNWLPLWLLLLMLTHATYGLPMLSLNIAVVNKASCHESPTTAGLIAVLIWFYALWPYALL